MGLREILPKDNVDIFLVKMKSMLDSPNGLTIIMREKNLDFMYEHNLTDSSVRQILKDLSVGYYCYTDSDRDDKYDKYENKVWIFFKPLYNSPEYIKHSVNIYIKLKLRCHVVCLSFHEAEHHLDCPYLYG